MDREKFFLLVKGVVIPDGELIKESTISSGESAIDWVPGWDEALYSSYQDWREKTHAHMLHRHMRADGRIDRHKVAAALMLAILESMPFQFREGAEENLLSVYLANEILALRVGLHVVLVFLREAAIIAKDTQALFILRRPFVFPSVAPGNDDYRLQTYRALYRLRESPKFENLLLLSNLLFVLETFHMEHSGSN